MWSRSATLVFIWSVCHDVTHFAFCLVSWSAPCIVTQSLSPMLLPHMCLVFLSNLQLPCLHPLVITVCTPMLSPDLPPSCWYSLSALVSLRHPQFMEHLIDFVQTSEYYRSSVHWFSEKQKIYVSEYDMVTGLYHIYITTIKLMDFCVLST